MSTQTLPEIVPVDVERSFAALLAEVVGAERVSGDDHFFDDLGADSMVMARFCARVRKRTNLPSVSIKDAYEHPTVRSLAAALASAESATTARPVPASSEPAATEAAAPAGTGRYVLCGAAQFAIFVGFSYVAGVAFVVCFNWISAGQSLVDGYLRSVLAGGAVFIAACTLPILAKWMLIGRWRPQQIRVWSLAYVRFWLVKTLVAANPLVLYAGSPIYAAYLRALGAKVGRGVVVFTRHAPVCTDLLSIGDGTVIRKDSYLSCYRAQHGMIETGPVTLGKNAFVGDKVVLDIGTSMGDGSQLGHASALHAGQAVPAGERWHGSPAQPTESDYRAVAPAHCSSWLKARYVTGQLLILVLVYLPVAFGGVAVLSSHVPSFAWLLSAGISGLVEPRLYTDAVVISAVLFVGGSLVRLFGAAILAHLLTLAVKPDTVYPLYGFRYSIHRLIMHLTNSKYFHIIGGDSSYIVPYLRSIGYKLRPVVQTGSNFGTEVKHETPYLCTVGSGTVIASGISILNANYSSTSFSVSRTAIGANSFLGNDIIYPPQGRTGDNCLLATKVLVPIDGEVREGVGLLGSPAFEIPRTVDRDNKFIQLAHGPDLSRRLAAKNRHNLASIGWYLLSRWMFVLALTVAYMSVLDTMDQLGGWAMGLADILVVLFGLLFFSLVERASTGFRGVRPEYCSIYERRFWRRERFFKLCARMGVHRLTAGTPFASLVWRMLGVRVGKRLFDDGVGMSEKNLVTIGDDVTLNAGSYIQCHSQEDYAFKSDVTTIGSAATVGVAAMVHYGVRMGEGTVLAADSFLMKGEEVPAHARWGGNPARELRDGELSGATGAGAILLRAPIPAADRRHASWIRPVSVAAAIVALALPVGVAVVRMPLLTTTGAATRPTPAVPVAANPSTVDSAADSAADSAPDSAANDEPAGTDATGTDAPGGVQDDTDPSDAGSDTPDPPSPAPGSAPAAAPAVAAVGPARRPPAAAPEQATRTVAPVTDAGKPAGGSPAEKPLKAAASSGKSVKPASQVVTSGQPAKATTVATTKATGKPTAKVAAASDRRVTK
jgi:non-ribosomal peptide synthetase-like protein